MFGIFLFWIHYIIAGVLLYTILRCSYKYIKVKNKDTWGFRLEKSDERAKFPLWLILLFILVFLIPVINLIVFILYMIESSDKDRIYYKSFLNKEY